MNAEKKQKTAAWIGGMIGFVLYLVVGLTPSLLFGRHGGTLIAGSVNAGQLTVEILSAGGMVLSFVVGLFCFVLLSAVIAQGITTLFHYSNRIDAELAANNGQLHPLPPPPTSSRLGRDYAGQANSAPSTSQDPKS